MVERIRKPEGTQESRAVVLGELMHEAVRAAIERAVHEELTEALGVGVYQRGEERRGHRNGQRTRQLSGPTGPLPLTLPRATLFTAAGEREWSSKLLPRHQRRLPELNEAIAGAYLSGANTRRIRGALRPLLKAAPLSKSAVSRVVATLKDALETWRKRSLAELEVVYLYLDAFALRVRSGGKVVSVPVLGAVAVLADGAKQLLSLELCGSESQEAWKGFLDDLVGRGLCGRRCCASSTATPGCAARWSCAGPERRCSAAWCTSCATSSARRPSTRARRSPRTFTASSTPRAKQQRARLP